MPKKKKFVPSKPKPNYSFPKVVNSNQSSAFINTQSVVDKKVSKLERG